MAEGLSALGHKVVLFATEESQVPKGGFLFKACKEIGTVNVDWLQAERSMWEKCDRYFDDFDVILGSNWFGMEYSSKVRNPSLKVSHLHHGGLNPEWWNKSKPPFKTNIIAISNWMKRVYASQGFNAQVAYNPVNLEKYSYQEDKEDYLMFLGRIDPIKAPHIAIEVAKKTNMKLKVVGGISFVSDKNYVSHIKQSCIDSDLEFIGEVDHSIKIKLLQNAKALLIPSQFGEPFGLVAVEAMSCGCTPVSLLDGALSEVIEDGVSGYVCKDVNEMVNRVQQLDKIDPKACRKRAEYFSVGRCAHRYESLFKDILEGYEW